MELFALASLALVAGVVSFTAPCTLPLLPGYVSYVSGLSPAEGERQHARRRIFTGALLFAAGFTLVFTAMGATASALGWFLARNTVWLDRIAGAFIVVMGLAFVGLVRLPWLLRRERRLDLSRFARGTGAAAPMGAAFALGWTPCIGPVLAGILATAAIEKTVPRGAFLLFAYSVGLTLPFLWIALGLARGRQRLAWLRRYTRHVEVTGGVLLIVMGIAVATGGWTAMMSRMLAWYAQLGWPPI
ncbi:MAG: cytochrome c biogenesis protein CcdA [Actinomycetota bacterium]|nr:cytochrome c biogenesis protein CcdA [Actinomycetota bacterium]